MVSTMSRGSDPAWQGWWYCLTPQLCLSDRPQPGHERAGVQVLTLESGGAFPLGHPTTRLSLDLLTPALQRRPVARLLEIGCGSGVLCIAAAALGVPMIVGLDLAAAAVRATRRNAARQAFAKVIQVVQGSSDCLRGSFDLVVANLPIDVQHDQVAAYQRLASPEGRLLLSGFREPEEADLLAQLRPSGWELVDRRVKYFCHPEMPPTLNFNWVAWLLARHGCN